MERGCWRLWWILMWLKALVTVLLLSLSRNSAGVAALGRGPVGVYMASNGKHVIVADSAVPGLVLVDLELGLAVERLYMDHFDADPTSVATCGDCRFLFVTCTSALYFVVHLSDAVDRLLSDHGRLGFSQDADSNTTVTIERLRHPHNQATDGRLVIMSGDGNETFLSSLEDKTVYRVRDLDHTRHHTAHDHDVNLTESDARRRRGLRYRHLHVVPLVTAAAKGMGRPYGISFTAGGYNLWVAMHKQVILKVDRSDGTIKRRILLAKKGCPGIERGPNLRKAMDDPTMPLGSAILILASFPRSYDAVLWRLHLNRSGESGKCEALFGYPGRHSNWVDGTAETVYFSRAHDFVLHPSRPLIIVTDIDNRALRLLDLTTMTSSSVMYDRDVRLREEDTNATLAKQQPQVCEPLLETGQATRTPLGTPSLVLPPSDPQAQKLTLVEAQDYCASKGLRLCEPSELRQASAALPPTVSWTSAQCASCWKKLPNSKCQSVGVGRFEKSNGGHHDHGFYQAWNAGFALEVTPPDNSTLALAGSTVCPGMQEQFNVLRSVLRADAPCCADCTA